METTTREVAEPDVTPGIIQMIPYKKMRFDPNQPRKRMDRAGIEALARSIDMHGLLQNPIVRPLEGGCFEMVAGERRARACGEVLGWKGIPCVVREIPKDQVIWAQIEENKERAELAPLELGSILNWLLENKKVVSQREIASRLHRDPSWVSQYIGGFRKIHPDIKDDQFAPGEDGNGKPVLGHAGIRQLIRLKRKEQLVLYREILENDLTTEEITGRVNEILAGENGITPSEGSAALPQEARGEPAHEEGEVPSEPEMGQPDASATDSAAEDIGDPAQADGDEPMSTDSDPGPELHDEDTPAEAETTESRAAAQPQDDRGIVRSLETGSLKVSCGDRELILAFDMHGDPSWKEHVRELLATLIRCYGVAEPGPGLSETGVSYNGRAAVVEDGHFKFSDADQEVIPISAVLDVFLQAQG